MSAQRQSAHTPHSQAHRSRSSGVNFGFFTERRRTPSWCRSATFSNWRAARVLKTDDRATNSVVSISSVRARRLWSLRKPHLLRSFEIYGRHRGSGGPNQSSGHNPIRVDLHTQPGTLRRGNVALLVDCRRVAENRKALAVVTN